MVNCLDHTIIVIGGAAEVDIMDFTNDSSDLQCIIQQRNTSSCVDKTDHVTWIFEYWRVHGYVAAVVYTLGILTNIANVVVLSRPKLASSPVNFLLAMIAVAELFVLAIHLPMAVYFYIIKYEADKEPLFSYDRGSAVYLYFCQTVGTVFHSIAVWHTVAVAAFRCLTLGLTNGKSYSTLKTARLCSLTLVVACFLVHIPNWMISEVTCYYWTDCDFTDVIFWFTGGKPGYGVHLWFFGVFSKLVPSVLLTTLTIPLVYIMNKAAAKKRILMAKGSSTGEWKKQQDHYRTTGMLLAVVVLFLCIELPQGLIVICMKENRDLQNVYLKIGEVIEIITLASFTVNIVLYTVMSRLFRQTFRNIFCRGYSDSLRQLSTLITSVKPSSTHKQSSSSNYSAAEMALKGNNRNKGNDNLLHPHCSPLLTDDTQANSVFSSTSGNISTEATTCS